MPEFHAPDGTRIFYTDDGEGRPVVALAGLTRTGRDFDYVAPHLDGVRLIRMDYRGRGRSAWADPGTYTVPTETGDVLALLDHLGLDRAAILGTSRGGLIAMTMAAVAKDRLSGVCLVDIGPEIAPEGLDAIKAYVGLNPTETSLEEAADMRARLLKGFVGVPASRWREEVKKHYAETPDGLKITYDPALRQAFLAATESPPPDLWPLFDALEGLPLALIRGANSDLLTPATADEMARRRPDMIRVDVPGRGHVPFLDEPEALSALRAWLETLP